MKIGFVTSEYVKSGALTGGLAAHFRKLARQMVRRGHQVTVFVASGVDSEWDDGGVRIVEVKAGGFLRRLVLKTLSLLAWTRFLVPAASRYFGEKALAAAAWKEHRREPFDIFQVAVTARASGFFLPGNGRVPVACLVAGYEPLCRSALGRKRALADVVPDWMVLREIDSAEAAFAPCRFTARVLLRLEGLEVDVIRTPVDEAGIELDDSFYRENLAGKRYLLFFGTLNRIKGADLLAPVAARVTATHPDIHFVFIGVDAGMPGRERVFDHIRDYPGVPPGNVHYFEPLDKPALYPVIGNALAAVLPSRVDNYPNTCLEAHAMGVPVIATRDSSLEEMVTDGETGFLADNGDPESIARAVERLLGLTGSESEAMGERIARHIERVRAEDRVGALLEYYQAVIGKWRAKAGASPREESGGSR